MLTDLSSHLLEVFEISAELRFFKSSISLYYYLILKKNVGGILKIHRLYVTSFQLLENFGIQCFTLYCETGTKGSSTSSNFNSIQCSPCRDQCKFGTKC